MRVQRFWALSTDNLHWTDAKAHAEPILFLLFLFFFTFLLERNEKASCFTAGLTCSARLTGSLSLGITVWLTNRLPQSKKIRRAVLNISVIFRRCLPIQDGGFPMERERKHCIMLRDTHNQSRPAPFRPQQPCYVLIIAFRRPPLPLTQITVHCVRKPLLSRHARVFMSVFYGPLRHADTALF